MNTQKVCIFYFCSGCGGGREDVYRASFNTLPHALVVYTQRDAVTVLQTNSSYFSTWDEVAITMVRRLWVSICKLSSIHGTIFAEHKWVLGPIMEFV
jgi:hypothetical protein